MCTCWGPLITLPSHPGVRSTPLLTRPKKDSTCRRVIMDISWLLPLGSSINGGTPRNTYLGMSKKMRLPPAQDLASLIRLSR